MNEILLLIENFHVQLLFHVSCSIVTLIVIFYIFFIKRDQFIATDLRPPLLYYNLSEQSKLLLNTVEVKTGLFIKNFPVFDMQKNNFIMDAAVWFEFNPSLTHLETIEDFSFERAQILSKSSPEMQMINGLLFVKYNVQVQFSSNLDHQFFPINDHRIYIVLSNENVSPQEIIFTVSESSFSWIEKLHTHDWNLIGKSVEAGYAELLLDFCNDKKKVANPRVIFTLNLSRSGLRKAMLIFLPLLIISQLGSYALILGHHFDSSVLSLAAGSVSGLLAYRFVIETVSPPVGYFTLTDYFYAVVLTIQFSVFVIGILLISMPDLKFLHVLSGFWFLLIQVTLIYATYYLLNKWNPNIKKKRYQLPLTQFKTPKDAAHFALDRKLKLHDLTEYAKANEEFAAIDNDNWLNPDFSSFYRSYTKKNRSFFEDVFRIAPSSIWNIELFRDILNRLTMEEKPENYVIKIKPAKNAKIIIFGDIHGAFHSLLRDLTFLESINVLDSAFKINNENHYFIFNGNVIDRSPYVLETLTIVMYLIMKNPDQVIYLKGNHEHKELWTKYQTQTELDIKGAPLKNEDRLLLKLQLTTFFDSLPFAAYIQAGDYLDSGLIRISHYSSLQLPYNESELGAWLNQKKSKPLSIFNLDTDLKEEMPFKIDAIFRGKAHSINFKTTNGLELLAPEEGATVWSLLSCPTGTYRELFQFVDDAFAILNLDGHILEWNLQLYYRDIRKNELFINKNFSLVFGMEMAITPFKKTKEITLGCTLDLTKTSAILGEYLWEGLQLGLAEKNSQGGVNQTLVRLIILDDQYTPHLARKNVFKFINNYKTNLILSPLGTPTIEAFLQLITEKQVLVLFPYTGASIFRKPELDHVIHFRTSYAKEAAALVHYAIETLGLKRFALFYQNDSYGWSPMEAAKNVLQDYGIKDWVEAPYLRNNPNIDAAAEKIIDFNPGCILFFSTTAPSIALVHKLGVNRIADKALLGISFLTDSFRNFLRTLGLELIISRVIPDVDDQSVAIVKEYHAAIERNYFHPVISEDSLEGYINANILMYVLENIKYPYNKEDIIKYIENIHNINFKGLLLDFDPNTRELSNTVWLDIGHGNWIKV